MRERFFDKKVEFFTVKQILELTNSKLVQENIDLEKKVFDVATLENAGEKQVSFLNSGSYLNKFKESKAGFCFVDEKNLGAAPQGMILIVNKNPYFAYSQLVSAFYQEKKKVTENKLHKLANNNFIHESAEIGENSQIAYGAYVGSNVKIGKNCYVGVNAVISDNCVIGDNCVINALAVISFAVIGNNVIIFSGVKIGQDGFGFAHNAGVNHKIIQIGLVEIADDVEIGANTCIDRGAIENTKIGKGVKIDNLVQIAHNVTIDQGTVIAGCSGIAGSASIGKFVQIGGDSSIAGHIRINDGAKIAGKSGVMRDVEAMQTVGGVPALPIRQWHRINTKLIALSKIQKSKEDAE